MAKYKHSLVACARWEECDVVEWVEYHRSIGFEHIYFYSNDDDWYPLYARLQPYLLGPRPFVTYTYHSRPGEQTTMYLHFLSNYKDETEWACFLDIDEFIVLKQLNNISAFMEEFEGIYDCVYFNWLVYGHNGRIVRENRGVLQALNRRSSRINPLTKTIFHTRRITAELAKAGAEASGLPITHFWNGYPAPLKMANVLGHDMRAYTNDFPRHAQDYLEKNNVNEEIIEKGYVAHFQFKSEEDFMRRVARGGFEAQNMYKEVFESGEYRNVLNALNEIEDSYLKLYWDMVLANSIAHLEK